MIIHQFLYQSPEQLYGQLSHVNDSKSCLIQIFTNALLPPEALLLAQKIRSICPLAHIIGTSVSGVIFQGEQYDNETLVVVEQYDRTILDTNIVDMTGKGYDQIGFHLHVTLGDTNPSLMRLFVGSYYDYAHQLIGLMNQLRPQLKIVGGMAGELSPAPQETPFVFDDTQVLANGLVYCALYSTELMVYGRINTAHETLEQEYTITQAKDRAILSIEKEPAQIWLQRNFGVLSTKEFSTWEEIAQNDPLVRLQLALSDHRRAIRFIHYDESSGEITQYFSRLPSGSKFRISYTSPSKCAEESMETCREVSTTPIEHLFCYSCLFRKLYLKNCAKWELSPYHRNPVNGVFLLGEFGYSEDGNALLNGSCVLSGVAEEKRYLSVDMSRLDATDDIRTEDEKLMDFIIRKQGETSSYEQKKILNDMIARESSHLTNPIQRMNVGVPVGDLTKYEQDDEHLRFNKLCMVRVENADVLISQQGQLGYFSHLKFTLESLTHAKINRESIANLHFYSIKDDTFLVAANLSVHREAFAQYIHQLQHECDEIQKQRLEMPFLLRFVLVRNHPFLLERAYAMMEDCRNSQLHVVTDQHFEDEELTPITGGTTDELSCIRLIQYALVQDGVVPYYQGLYNNQTGRVDKYEALMRLRDGDGRIYAPYHFMEISKKYRLYLDLNLKMFHAVLRDFSQLDCGVSINLSVHDILSQRFCQEMRQALAAFPNPSNLTFELVEDECVANMEGIQSFISEVRSYGVKIAIDDFGSGYSNLLEIVKIRPDFIKIDGQIINNVENYEENESILEAVALLGKRLSIDLVAEFVETAAIQERIVSHRIFYSQGYHFSKPKPFAQVLSEVNSLRRLDLARPDLMYTPPPAPQKIITDILSQEERNFFRAIQALTSDILLRLNFSTCCLEYYGDTQRALGQPSIIQDFPHSVANSDWLATEDIPALLRCVEQMRQGVEEPAYFRIVTPDLSLHWYRLDYTIIRDHRGVPQESIGKLTNIQQQKDLENRINIDPMTGCLRKDIFESLVSDFMVKNPAGKGILLIIDLDNFKSVNDNLGHQFGDRVLRGVGDKLRAQFRGEDYVGRIGGDEFMVMMTGTNDLEIGKRKAGEILSALDATYTGSVHAYHVSASIGIATYPHHGSQFQTLYDHADVALFDAKNRGKNGFVIYHDTLSKGTMENTLPYEVAVRTLAQHYDPQVVEKAFNLLFETREFDISIGAVLELIGTRFGVSRCYIFEPHPTEPQAYQNTYEWCNQGISSEQHQLNSVSLDLFQEFFDQANGDGILYCNDLSMLTKEGGRALMESQGIQSFLHTYITSDNTISYLIGMDECNTSRVWTPIEMSTLSQTGKIIAQFLSYKKAMFDLQAIASERLSVLNSLNYYAYIVDRKTHELTYFNDYTKKAIPRIELGQHCYETIRQKASPCEDCPLKVMEDQGATNTHSLIYESTIGRNLLTMSALHPSFAGRECASITAISLDDLDGIKVVHDAT